jgi:hypothetical protein
MQSSILYSSQSVFIEAIIPQKRNRLSKYRTIKKIVCRFKIWFLLARVLITISLMVRIKTKSLGQQAVSVPSEFVLPVLHSNDGVTLISLFQ